MNNLDPKRARWIRARMALVCFGLASSLGLVINGAYQIQVNDGASWLELAEKQRQRRLHLQPKRGSLYDRTGAVLSESIDVPSVSIDSVEMLRGIDDPYVQQRADQYAARIAEALGLDAKDVAERILRRKRFVWLKRRISEDEVAKIHALEDKNQRYPIRGLRIEGESRRFYPNRELAGPLLGFVAPDGEGKDGLELAMEGELAGHMTEINGLRDRSGRLLFSDGVLDEHALTGHHVELTIDKGIQFMAERELEAARTTHEAVGGAVVVIDPSTGEILAMANTPGFNPNDYGASSPDDRRNRAITDRLEPGSTMKVFSIGLALAAGVVTPESTRYCEKGRMAVDNVIIHDTHPAETLNVTQILAYSSNICTAKIAFELGERRLYEGLRRFGFGEATGLPLVGESAGVLRPRNRPWVNVELASAAFGQGISTTVVQLVMALGAVANGGNLMEPILVKRILDESGTTLTENLPRVKRRVMSKALATTLSEMLVAVTEGEGTGVEAAVPGFKVAGKTATAQKIDPVTGRYNDHRHVASFIGFVPAERPRLAIAVLLDEPGAGAYTGGTVAAPVFRRVAEGALRYLGVTPRPNEPRAAIERANQELAAQDAADVAREVFSDATPVIEPEAPPQARPMSAEEVRLPDLRGWPAREVVRTALGLGLLPELEGSGRLLRMSPPAGSILPRGGRVKLVFAPPT